MPFEYTPEDHQHAKELWEGGHKPKEVELEMGNLHGCPVPARTISNWANEERWRHWSIGKLELLNNANPDLPFGVSKIKDPVFHDAEAIAKNWCRGDGYVEDGPIKPVIQGALAAVARQKVGVPVAVLDYLSKVVLRPFIKELRKNKPLDPRLYVDPERQAIIDAVEFIKEDDEETSEK